MINNARNQASTADDCLLVFARPDQLEVWQKGERFAAAVREDAVAS